MEDEAAAAALAVEFIQSLDNLPHEVSHTFKEIEHKDTKVQELMHKIHNREVQLRNLLIKASAGAPQPPDILSDQDSAKVQKLGDKIRADYARADELSGQNEQLSIALWRSIFRHNQRLSDEMAKVSPTVISNVAAGLANSNAANAPSVLGLPAALASLRGPNGAYDPALLAAAAGIAQSQQMAAMLSSQSQTPQLAGQKRKAGGSGISSPATIPTPLSSSQSNPFSRVVSSNIPLGNFVGSNRSSGFGGIGIGGRPATPTFELPTGILSGGPLTPIDRPSSAGGGNNRNRKSNQNGGNNRIGMGGAGGNKGSSNLSRKKEEEFEEELEDGEEEKDETLYCTCQRVSFGEMIGCDSDDCKYEWFHIGCVGVSKPLPQTWYCPDCSAERRKRRK